MSTNTSAPATKVSRLSEREFRIERDFNASRERVWRAHTVLEQLAQWWGRGNRLEIERYEFVRGGHWRFVEQTPDGPQGFEGRFREIDPPQRLEQTFEWDGAPGHAAVTTIELQDLGDGRTRLVSTMLFLTREDCDGMVGAGMEGGMNESYAILDRLLASAA